MSTNATLHIMLTDTLICYVNSTPNLGPVLHFFNIEEFLVEKLGMNLIGKSLLLYYMLQTLTKYLLI